MPATSIRTTDETIKETFESIVIAFILAFIFRAYVVEAFVIPTGSMAPTLLGQHSQVRCAQCGYRFTVDQSGKQLTADRQPAGTPCPMCRFPQPVRPGVPTQSGDRLLVQKYIYYVADPSRWDIVVFRNPQARNADGSPGPQTNYIKRLVGLPNESLYIIDGNIYVQPLDQPNAPWRIARKTDPAQNRHWEKIQRSVWQPIYHSRYVPLDHGNPSPQPNDRSAATESTRRFAWSCPWEPTVTNDPRWELGDAEQGWRRSYSFTPPSDADPSDRVGELRFNWRDYHGRGTVYPYNYTVTNQGIVGRQPIEETRLAASVVPEAPGVYFELETSARLGAVIETVVARFDAEGKVTLLRRGAEGESILAENHTGRPMRLQHATPVELWFVDQELLVWVDGRVVIRRAFDLSLAKIKSRVAPQARPDVAVRIVGGPATLHAVQLDRDLAYTPSLSSDLQVAQVGVLRRAATGALISKPPMSIDPGRYFVLGDNSPISSDGRFWNDVEPWVEKRMFDPDDSADASGASNARGEMEASAASHLRVVPRGLMVGRAFFIYFPAPYAISRGGDQVLPNFGDMRFVH